MTIVTSDLIIRAQRGNPGARAAIVEALYPYILRVARAIPSVGASGTKDFVQDAVYRVLRGLDRVPFDHKVGSASGYVFGLLYQCGRGGVFQSRRREMPLTETEARLVSRVQATRDVLYGRLTRDPNLGEIQEELVLVHGICPKLDAIDRVLQTSEPLEVNPTDAWATDSPGSRGVTVRDGHAHERPEYAYRLREFYDIAACRLSYGPSWVFLHEVHERIGLTFPEVYEVLAACEANGAADLWVGAILWSKHHRDVGLPRSVPTEAEPILSLFQKGSGKLIESPALRARWNAGRAFFRVHYPDC